MREATRPTFLEELLISDQRCPRLREGCGMRLPLQETQGERQRETERYRDIDLGRIEGLELE